MMLRSPLLCVAALALMVPTAAAQDSRPASGDLTVSVPAFQNETCPIMGKPAKSALFVETANGRIYVCCKACNKKIAAAPEAAYSAAYKTVKKIANTTCPVTGDEIGADAPTMSLQGHEFKICCEGCRKMALEQSQLVLVKLTNPKAADVGNETCPLTGKPVAPNAIVLIGDDVVHLASPDGIEQVRKDPKSALKKAKEIRAAQDKAGGKSEKGCCSEGKAKGGEGCCSEKKKDSAADGCCSGAKKGDAAK